MNTPLMNTLGVSFAVLPAAQERATRPISGAVHWARLGDQTIVWSPVERVAEGVATLEVTPSPAAGLALVTQVGRVFQAEHPNVRVVLDHGRHLVVDTATLPDGLVTDDICWRVEPLPEDTVVVDRPVVAAARSDPATAELLNLLSPSSFDNDLKELVGFGTRQSWGSGFVAAAEWAADRLMSLGYTVAEQPITVGTRRSRNVIADRTAQEAETSESGDLVLVMAHLDSVNLSGGPTAAAPGADDNGSGSAGVLELARVLASTAWRSNLRLILFGGEEQGLHGSRQYVAGLPPVERQRVRAVLNMDMVGTRNADELAVLLEGAPLSQHLIDHLATAAATYTGLRVETSLKPFASDHVPCIEAGVPAVLTIEGADSANGNIHTAGDTLDHLDLDLMHEILRMNLAALASWLSKP
jgi:hypothetical protein